MHLTGEPVPRSRRSSRGPRNLKMYEWPPIGTRALTLRLRHHPGIARGHRCESAAHMNGMPLTSECEAARQRRGAAKKTC